MRRRRKERGENFCLFFSCAHTRTNDKRASERRRIIRTSLVEYMSVHLKHILLSSNNLKKTCEFFTKGLGFSLVVCTDTFAELLLVESTSTTTRKTIPKIFNTNNTSTSSVTLAVQQKILEEDRSNNSTDTNISLNFEVSDVDHAVKQLLELGGTLDGPIQFTSDKSKTVEKIAAMTTMDGHSIGLFEPKERKNE